MRFWFLTVAGLVLSPYAAADTEITNFEAVLSQDASLGQYIASWRVLQPGSPSIASIAPAPRGGVSYTRCNFTVQYCPHEIWFVLDTRPGMHTLRISYPATDSVQYTIQLHSSASLLAYIGVSGTASGTTSRSYARVTSRRVGILTPGMAYEEPIALDFHIALERVLLGVLPQSMLPVVAAIAVALSGVAFALPRLFKTYDRLARDARHEVRKAQ